MPAQYILLQTYLGASDFFYTVTCDGESISQSDATLLGFATGADFYRHKNSDYDATWFKIVPGTQITVSIADDERDQHFTFVVPEKGLPNPPVTLDDERGCHNLHLYLQKHCLQI